MSWKYKVCKLHHNKKTYTVVDRQEDKEEAVTSLRGFLSHDRSHKYIIKRYSDKE